MEDHEKRELADLRNRVDELERRFNALSCVLHGDVIATEAALKGHVEALVHVLEGAIAEGQANAPILREWVAVLKRGS